MRRSIFKNSVILTLATALALMAIVPRMGFCQGTATECGTERCCGACCQPAEDSSSSCCSPAPKLRLCCCGEPKPVIPLEKRLADDKVDLVRGEQTAAHGVVEQPARSWPGGLPSAFFRPAPPRIQAVLCCWLN